MYEINLLTYTCTCSDFPRIQLCKHIAATVHFFGGELEGEPGPWALDNTSTNELEPDVPKSLAQKDGSAGNAITRTSVISVVNDIVRLAQDFLEIAPDPETVKSLQMARSQLNTT